jgi:uncharacterized protein (TIRG00374 family)
LTNLRGKFILSLLFGVAVFIGLAAYGDFSDVGDAIGDFRWELAPAILALTLLNYLLRFIKWDYYLGQIGVRGLSKWNSFLLFFSGLAMVITPGKVGEWLKSYLLREVHGTPVARSAPILIAERFTDTIALLLLATAGLIIFGEAWEFFLVVGVGAVVIIILARHRPTMRLVLRAADRLPVVSRYSHILEEFYESTHVLFAPRCLFLMTVLSTVSWLGEVLAFYLVLVGLGLDATGILFVQAAFIMPVATVAGAVLLTPGGLGVAEGGLTGLLQVIVDMEKGPAAVATLIIRIGTLWFGVFVGLATLVPMTRRVAAAAAAAAAAEAAPASLAGASGNAGEAWAADTNPLGPDSARRRSL